VVRWRLRHRREQHVDSPPEPVVRSSDPAARGARARRSGAGHEQSHRFEHAAARFNASEAGHTVRGLVKTLGDPWVSVGAAAGAADEVRVTVAWELSWYQWGVDLGDETRPVYELGRGREIAEIDAAARQWNASVLDGGRVAIVAPDRRRAQDGTRR
jgi:hypothetical protein